MRRGCRGIFILPAVGYLGRKPVDRQYMQDVEARAKKLRKVCDCPVSGKQKDIRQGKLFG